jgi:catechol 2,3-dioxygenase-like lactoylglutathione lyase family enzyme
MRLTIIKGLMLTSMFNWMLKHLLRCAGLFLLFSGCMILMLNAAWAQPSAQGRMLRPLLLTHVVENLNDSIAFYRQGLDFEVVEGPGSLTASALVQKVVAETPTARARYAIMEIPGSALSLQLIEFEGAEGRPFQQRLYDPGVTRFSIQVRDIDLAFERVKDLVMSVDTVSAGPVYTQRPRNNTRAVMLRDPDGFVFEFVQSGNPIQTDVPASSNIYDARSSLALENIERAMEFYGEILGFVATREPGYVNDAVLALEGTPRARARNMGTMPPGSANPWFFWEFRDIVRTKRSPDPQDPGASAITLQVENIQALADRIYEAGHIIETPGGQAVQLDNNSQAILVRSPDGLLVELVEL